MTHSNESDKKNERYQLILDVKHCIYKARDDTKILFSMFDNTKKEFLSQQYCLHLSENNFPKVGNPEDIKMVFKDLPNHILANEIYIVATIYRIGNMDAPDVMNYRYRHNKRRKRRVPLMRPYGVSIFRLKDYMIKLRNKLGEEIHIEPGEARIFCPKEESDFLTLVDDIINEKNNFYVAPLSIGVCHSYTLYCGDINVVEKSYEYCDKVTILETLKSCNNIENKLTGSYLLYVTAVECHVNQRNKRASCNVAVKMNLKKNKTMENCTDCIRFGKSSMSVPSDEITTAIYHHNNDPIYNQRFTVLLPNIVTEIQDCHLFFSCWHVSAVNRKPDDRGFGFMKLSDVIKNSGYNEYDIPLYRNSKKNRQKNYLSSDSNVILQLESCNRPTIKIGIDASNLQEYLCLIVFGYINCFERQQICNIPYDLKHIIFAFV